VLPSKPTGVGQMKPAAGFPSFIPMIIALGLMGCLAACGPHADEAADCPAAVRARSVSGFCVPRYVSLKRGEVFARKGPGVDYPALWVYRAKGLPVQVVGETEEWRRICDPYGAAVWVHRSMVDGRRSVQATGPSPAPLHHQPKDDARTVGFLNPRAIASLEGCNGDWCVVRVGDVKGWVRAEQVWGTSPKAQCR